jgi:arsenate reductase (thioredoxin)
MAEGFLRHIAGDRFEVFSAGARPTDIRPEAIKVMDEIGIDISGHYPKFVDKFIGQNFDYVVTVCDSAKEACPVFPGKAERLHWSFEDPAAVRGSDDERLSAFRKIRDEIRTRIGSFLGTVPTPSTCNRSR